MEFRTLRAFVEVVRQGGFSQAAKAVCTTQLAVSKAVRQLEDEIGIALLDRSGHRVILTDAGQAVYRRGLQLLAGREDLVAEIEEIRGLKRGVLRLGLPPIGSNTLFARPFAQFRQRYPGIEVRLAEHGSDQLQNSLRGGDVDLAALLLPAPPDFAWQAVRREPLVVLLPTGHPLLTRPRVALADLKGLPFILFEEGFALNRMILAVCTHYGFRPEIAARSSQIEFIIELAAAGIGAAFLPRMIAVQRPHAGVGYAEVADPGTEWSMALMWRRGAYLSHAARAWIAIARDSVAEQAHTSGLSTLPDFPEGRAG